MPLDLRTTVFSDQELATALLEYARRNDVKLPPSRVEHVNIEWEPQFSVTMYFFKDALGRIEKLNFEKNETAAALILYCHQYKEPVPHHAQKSLLPYTGGIQLLLRFPWGEEWDERHPARNLTFPSMREEGE